MRLSRIATTDGVAFASIHGTANDTVYREIDQHPFGTPTYTGREWKPTDVRLLAPILATKVVCVGKNYADHAMEMGGTAPESPLIFLKPNTSIVGPGAKIVKPSVSKRVDFEGELAVVIGQPCKNVDAYDASSVILGYTVGNDVTARDLQESDGQWTRAKGFDTFCPLGPWIETELDPGQVDIKTEVTHADGTVTLTQDGNAAEMIHTVGEIIEFISSIMTLLPGDVILTGTPAGIGPLVAGDTVSVTVEGIGTLTNPVVD